MPAGAHIIPADHLPRCSRYAAMIRDVGHNNNHTRGNGVLTRDELESYIQAQYDERNRILANQGSTRSVDVRLRDSEQMLHDMVDAGVDGLSYLPEEIQEQNFRPELAHRVVEMLMKDDEDRSLRITQPILDRARGRYMNIEARSMVELNSRDRALNEIKEIAQALGLF